MKTLRNKYKSNTQPLEFDYTKFIEAEIFTDVNYAVKLTHEIISEFDLIAEKYEFAETLLFKVIQAQKESEIRGILYIYMVFLNQIYYHLFKIQFCFTVPPELKKIGNKTLNQLWEQSKKENAQAFYESFKTPIVEEKGIEVIKRIYTVKELQEYFKCSKSKLYQLFRDNKLKYITDPTGHRLVRLEDLKEFEKTNFNK